MDIFNKLKGFLTKDLAMDLGTANTLIYLKGTGIVLNEPSVVSVPSTGGGVLAVGKEAKAMYGRAPNTIRIVRPMKDGVIADFEITHRMITYFIRKIYKRSSIGRPKMIIAVPSGITQVEKRAVIESAEIAGARQITLIEEPMAAAIGAKLPIHGSEGNMVVDIGGGTTEVAVICYWATNYCESLRVAGDEMDEAIVRHARKKYNMDIGIFEAERVKIAIGSASPLDKPKKIEMKGKHLLRGVPCGIEVDDEFARDALNDPVVAIIGAIKMALERSSPEQAADIVRKGIVLAGGGALLQGLGPRIHKETGLPVFRAKDPLTTVVRGSGEVLENFKRLKKVCIS